MSLQPGEVLGGCRIVEKLGEGGMGEVFRAHQVALNRPVAVKVLDPALREEDLGNRFAREMKVHLRLSHPRLVKVYGAGEERDLRYLILELVEGSTLRAAIAREKRQSWEAAAGALRQVLEALAYLDAAGLVHRDLKPENILVDLQGGVKLADFGLVKCDRSTVLTRANQIVGTVKYLAPEVLHGENFGPKVDVYAAGLIFHELLTGRPPYQGKDTHDWMRLIMHAPIPPLRDFRQDLGRNREAFVARLLEKDPARRPTASEALELLDHLEAGGSYRWSGPHARIAAGAAVAAVVAMLVIAPKSRTSASATTLSAAGARSAAQVEASASVAARREEAGWVQVIPRSLPAGVPVVPYWKEPLIRDREALSNEEWKTVFDHNLALDVGEDSDVWLALAVHHGRGLGVVRDLVKAKHFLKKSVRAGNGFAMVAMGFDPRSSRRADGTLIDRATHERMIEEWLQPRARAGLAAAQFELAILYSEKKRIPEAIPWMEKAAAQGLGIAHEVLGQYYGSYAEPRDMQRAHTWYRKGADLGDPGCLTQLGWMARDGNVEPRDRRAEHGYFEKAARGGHPWGALVLAKHFARGETVARDPVQADRWFRRCQELCELEAFRDLPVHSAVEASLASLGYRIERVHGDEEHLIRGAIGL